MILIKLLLLILSLILFSCGAKFSCPAPKEGITCTPVSKVYEIYNKGIKQTEETKDEPQVKSDFENYIKKEKLYLGAEDKNLNCIRVRDNYLKQKYENLPIKTPPKIIRILITPYIDEDDDFVQGTFIYTEIPSGKWILGEKIEKQATTDFKRFREIYPAYRQDSRERENIEIDLKTSKKEPTQLKEDDKECEDELCK